MSEPEARQSSGVRTGLAGVGALALIVACCAALPLVVAFAGSIAVGTVLGLGAGAVVLIVLVGLVAMRSRRRAACESHERASPPADVSRASEREVV